MRPARLEFSGLRSYRQRTTIDFADLDLFAIIGDTGSGKSTVIEALSLALYGRKTWTGGSNLEELIADGENTMAIELVFAAEDNEWTVTRSRHRNSSAPVNKLECPALGEKVDGNKAVNERIEQLLGLDHSQFVRAVVLPQGRFDELLQATRTDRNKILRSIFGLDDLRRVRDDATRRRDRWRPIIEAAVARREVLDPNPAQSLAAARAAASTLDQRLAKLTEVASTVDAELADREALERRLAAVRAAGDRLAIDPGLADEVPALADRASQLVTERHELQSRRDAFEQVRRQAAEQQTALLNGFENQGLAVRSAALLRSVAATIADLDTDAASAHAEIERLLAAAPSAEEATELVTAVSDAQTLVEAAASQLESVARRASDAMELWQQYSAAVAELSAARTADTEASTAATEASTAATRALAAVDTTTAALVAARSANDLAIRNNAAVVAAHGLEPGHSCPVCTQSVPDGFVAPVASDVDTAAVEVERAEGELVAAQRAATTAETTAGHRTQAAAAAKSELEAALIRIGERRAAVAAADLDPEAVDQAVALTAVHAAQARAETALTEVRAQLELAERARSNAAAERASVLAAHVREVAAARANAERIAERQSAQRSQLSELPTAWSPDGEANAVQIESVADRIDSMLTELEAVAASVAEAAEAEAATGQRFAELRSDAVENVTSPLSSIMRTLNDHIAGAEALNEVAEPGALETPSSLPDRLPHSVLLDDVGELAVRIQQVVDALGPLATQARQLHGQLDQQRSARAQRVVDALTTAGVADPAALHAAVGAARAEAAQSARDIERLEAQLQQADQLDAVLVTGRPYLANLEVLIQSLRDQHFVDHLVSAREVELLAEATRRLKAISGGRYGFVPDFGVVRIASGEVRSPDTLSGGERFQAALALALALVEIASRGAGKLDAVFVDEGFGSLDGAALDVALDTLGSVAGGGKLVALISHLHPVAEYVDTVFNVTKDDLFGSSITKLDAEAREELLADDIRSGLTS